MSQSPSAEEGVPPEDAEPEPEHVPDSLVPARVPPAETSTVDRTAHARAQPRLVPDADAERCMLCNPDLLAVPFDAWLGAPSLPLVRAGSVRYLCP